MKVEKEETYYDVKTIDCSFNMECATCAEYAAQADDAPEEEGDEEKKEEPINRSCTIRYSKVNVEGKEIEIFIDINHVSALHLDYPIYKYQDKQHPRELEKALVYRTEISPSDDNVSASFYFLPRTKCLISTGHNSYGEEDNDIKCERMTKKE